MANMNVDLQNRTNSNRLIYLSQVSLWDIISQTTMANYHNRGKRRQAEQRVATAMGISSQHICFTFFLCKVWPLMYIIHITHQILSPIFLCHTPTYSSQHFALKLKTELKK